MPNGDSTLDKAFAALADPSRRAAVERLARGPASVSALARLLAMSMPAAMQHLALLEGAGLVASEKKGRVRTCRIRASGLREVERWIDRRRADWESRLDEKAE